MSPLAGLFNFHPNPSAQNQKNMNQIERLKTVSDSELQKLADQARSMGMSDDVIKQGLEFIKSLK